MTQNNEEGNISISSLQMKRPNYPINCFALDVSKNQEIKKNGVRFFQFDFVPMPQTAVAMLVEDKRLFSSRLINENEVYFSGSKIKQNLDEQYH